jgi:hypothetical protein
MPTSRPNPRRTDPLIPLRHITERDEALLSLLSQHQVLTTAQIATALFPSLRAAQKRLTLLYRIGALDRFVYARRPADTGGMRYTLGPLGSQLHPRPGARRTSAQHSMDIARNPKQRHLLGVNGFFTDLLGHARTHPGTHLRRWWNETDTTAVHALAGVHPDGHGIWETDGTTVGFFLEYDTGSEVQRLLLAKLPAYERLAVAGPRYPVLFYLPGTDRETNLHHNLAGRRLPFIVATAIHGRHPASPVWRIAGHPGPRLRLHDLPSDHGPTGVGNPHRYEADPA